MEFTRRELSCQSDRLPALSGLADLMLQQTRDSYLCGLWKADLAFEILWYSDHQNAGAKGTQRHKDCYAPSWSWASIFGPVRYYNRFVGPLARRNGRDEVDAVLDIIEAAVFPSGPNIYGPACRGYIKAHGLLMPVKFDISQNTWQPVLETKGGFEDPTVSLDVPTEFPGRSRRDYFHSFAFLLVARYIHQGRWSTPSSETICLLLRQSEILHDQYTRIGFVLEAFPMDAWNSALASKKTITIL